MYQREMFFGFHEVEEDATESNVEISLFNEGTEYLPTIIERFQTFLRAAGFDYVTIQKLDNGTYGYGSVN